MPKKSGSDEKYMKGAAVTFLVFGIDDVSTLTLNKLKNIEAGSWLHGYIVVRTPVVPPEGSVALAKFEIKGKHLVHEYKTKYHKDEEGNEHSTIEHDTDKKTWLKLKTKSALPLQSVAPSESGVVLTYPYSFQVGSEWCDSFKTSHAQCQYEIKLKVKYVDCPLRVKTSRDLEIMRRRPTHSELHRKVPCDIEKHSSLAGGSVEAAITLNSCCFVEGTQVTFTAVIKNSMERPIMSGKLELEEHLEYTTKHKYEDDRFPTRYETAKSVRDLVVNKLRGLEIPGKSERTLIFALDLPKIVEPPTTGFHQGKHKCEVKHYLKMQLDVPWGSDVRTKFKVMIVPNPARYFLCSPPPGFLQGAAMHSMVSAKGNTYATIPPTPIPPVVWEPIGVYNLQIELVKGRKLPKMDFTFGGLRGAADPYVTLFLNDLHVRTSRVVNNSTEPHFGEIFTFFLDEDGFNPAENTVELRMNCYDSDRASKDDKIGDGQCSLSVLDTDEIEIPLTIEHKKKGTIDRGFLYVKVHSLERF